MAPRQKSPRYFPIHLVRAHPVALAMGSAAIGILYRILEHYWATDCRDLPERDQDMMALARAHRATWVAHKQEIYEVLRDLAPAIREAWRKREINNVNLMQLRERAAAARAAKLIERRGQAGVSALVASIAPVSSPATAPNAVKRGFRD